MNVSNWWGVLYGITGLFTLTVAATVLAAFFWIHNSPMAEERTWTGPTPEPDHDNVIRFAKDINREP